MTYGNRLSKALKETGKTRKQLAAALECSVQAIGMVITGGGKVERGLSAENNAKAARFLRIDGYWLATGKGEMRAKPSEHQKELSGLSDDAVDIAVHFDKLTNDEDRTRAYVAAMAAILGLQAEREAKSAALATPAPAPAESPKKQSS